MLNKLFTFLFVTLPNYLDAINWGTIEPLTSTDNNPHVPVVVTPPPQTPTIPVDEGKHPYPLMIIKWADLIAVGEGATKASNNPGNLKYSSLTASWGATKGRAALDGGFLCQFPDYRTGATALCNFLILGCEDQLRAFHAISLEGKPQPEARTLEGFTKIYAGNPPQPYIDRIVHGLGVSPTVQISTFLT